MINNNKVKIWDSLGCCCTAIFLSISLQRLAWMNAGVIKRCRKQSLSAEINKLYRGKMHRIKHCYRNPHVVRDLLASRVLPLRCYYFFHLRPDYKQVKKAIRLPGRYKPSSRLEPKKLNRLHDELLTIPGILESSGSLTTQPALELEEVIVDKLFWDILGVRLQEDSLKCLSTIEQPSVVLLLFLKLCGCPKCQFVLSTEHIIELMECCVANQLYNFEKKKWVDIGKILQEDQDYLNIIKEAIRDTTDTLKTILSMEEKYDVFMITLDLLHQCEKLLHRDNRVFENPDIHNTATKNLVKNIIQYTKKNFKFRKKGALG